MRRLSRFAASLLLVLLSSSSAVAQEGPGLAARYPNDVGLADDPAVLYFLDFDDEAETMTWSQGVDGYGWTDEPSRVFAGNGALEIQQTTGTHNPSEIHPAIDETDIAYVRWYRMWEPGYDFNQHKMSGVYAKAPGASGAGEVPTGYDKYSCKLFVDFERRPRFYSYHPEQSGPWGDSPQMNLVDPPMQMEADRWYCFEMMIKANAVGQHDGELKMWIDGQLVGHIEGMRFRDTADLKINQFTYSAYVGGDWTSDRDQKLWDDQIVVAREYIGPLATEGVGGGATGGGAAGGGGANPSGSSGAGAGSGNSTPAAAAGSDESGCGCRTAGGDDRNPTALLLLTALAAMTITRRRRLERPRPVGDR